MAPPRVPNCPVCGVKKTPENTSILTKTGCKGYYHRHCKRCDSDRVLRQRWDDMTIEEVIKVREKYLVHYERVDGYLTERKERSK